jgi:hypothetical protein
MTRDDADPYLSHPVRRIRDDPTPGERVGLVVELADGTDPAVVRDAVADLGGRVTGELRFADLRVELPEPAVAAFLDRGGLTRVETTDTVGLGINDG